MHMQCDNAQRQRRRHHGRTQRVQQRDRIASAGKGHRHRACPRAVARNNKGRTGLKRLCDLVGQAGGRVSPVRRFP
ncbi:hypothetical protein CS8_062600 [Cupriavidus sp. 8B]